MTVEFYPDREAVYRDNVRRVYQLMLGRVGNRADAEDLASEVFLAALYRLRLPAARNAVRAYLLATSRTVLASHWRRRGSHQACPLPDNLAEVRSRPCVRPGAAERAHQILGALPARYRRILELRFLEGCTLAESAQILGISVSNAKVLQHRALRRAACTSRSTELQDGFSGGRQTAG